MSLAVFSSEAYSVMDTLRISNSCELLWTQTLWEPVLGCPDLVYRIQSKDVLEISSVERSM